MKTHDLNGSMLHTTKQIFLLRMVTGLALMLVAIWPHASLYAVDDNIIAWRFNVMLDDKPIGHHDFVVRRQGNHEFVEIDAKFDVRYFKIPFYTYRHSNLEQSSGGCLTMLRSETNDNGDRYFVDATSRGDHLYIKTDDNKKIVDRDCVMSFAYWNPAIVERELLLNAQTGEIVPVSIKPTSSLPTDSDFTNSELNGYRITSHDSELDIVIWYQKSTGRWTHLESRLESGKLLRYLPGDPSSALRTLDDFQVYNRS